MAEMYYSLPFSNSQTSPHQDKFQKSNRMFKQMFRFDVQFCGIVSFAPLLLRVCA